MMCLIDMQENEIKGFVIGIDPHDLRRKLQNIQPFYNNNSRIQDCMNALYAREYFDSGIHSLPGGYKLLVD